MICGYRAKGASTTQGGRFKLSLGVFSSYSQLGREEDGFLQQHEIMEINMAFNRSTNHGHPYGFW